MQTIDQKQTGNDYTAAATLSEVWNSSGGYAVITVADVYMQLEWGQQGTQEWTREVHVPVGNIILNPGTIGVRFRSYTTGTPATVTAALAGEAEPAITIGTPSTATVTMTGTEVTGNVTAAGAITWGSGFTAVRTGVGSYTITFTTPFASPPTVTGAVLIGLGRVFAVDNSTPLAGSFKAIIYDSALAPVDCAFMFVAVTTV